jgi:hypothetical protein
MIFARESVDTASSSCICECGVVQGRVSKEEMFFANLITKLSRRVIFHYAILSCHNYFLF